MTHPLALIDRTSEEAQGDMGRGSTSETSRPPPAPARVRPKEFGSLLGSVISSSVPLEPGVGIEPTSATVTVYCGLLLGRSAARRLSRSAFGGQANPGLVCDPDGQMTTPSPV